MTFRCAECAGSFAVAVLSVALGSACSRRPPEANSTSLPSFAESSLAARSSPKLVGAWHVVELAVRAPGGEWDIRPRPQGGLYVFSTRHYSYVYIPGGRARPRFSHPNPGDAEKAAAYDTFIAGAGSYTFDGNTLDLRADLRKNPSEMTGEIWRWTVESVSADTLRFVFHNPPFLPGRDWRTTLVRAD